MANLKEMLENQMSKEYDLLDENFNFIQSEKLKKQSKKEYLKLLAEEEIEDEVSFPKYYAGILQSYVKVQSFSNAAERIFKVALEDEERENLLSETFEEEPEKSEKAAHSENTGEEEEN